MCPRNRRLDILRNISYDINLLFYVVKYQLNNSIGSGPMLINSMSINGVAKNKVKIWARSDRN